MQSSPIAARMALAEKVEVQHDAAITARGSRFRHMVRVEVHLQDGTRMRETVEAPRGSETSFASEADVVAKFLKLAAHAVSTPAAERIVDLVLNLERVEDGREVVQSLALRERCHPGPWTRHDRELRSLRIAGYRGQAPV